MKGDESIANEDGPPEGELGLFVIWEKARHAEDAILADLELCFEILHTREVHWTPGLALENFERFYADLTVRGVYHALNKGSGPFVAITVHDPAPILEERQTTRGPRMLNAHFLDAKMRYREMTGVFSVHSSETPWETAKDLMMLFGREPEAELREARPPGSAAVHLERDLTGARSFESARQVFDTLNRTVDYVVMDAAPSSLEEWFLPGRRPVELLTDDYHALRTILNARPVARSLPRHGGCLRFAVAEQEAEVEIRFVGDQYYDPGWARALLAARWRTEDGIYRLPTREAFETHAYRSFVHKPRPRADDEELLIEMAAELELSAWTSAAFEDPRRLKALLDEILERAGAVYTRPLDKSAFYNYRFVNARWPAARRLSAGVVRHVDATGRLLARPFEKAYWGLKGRLLLNAPWVRSLKHIVRRSR